ncbi:hypothetical protein P1J78_22300 [Psychromarinibacter sp. C21-152]|uniref:Uncharacterized protein n=1 Tax=Psychromarinibacter sediminicola TaxID=3033385 RepID=A0AAE3NWU1_9RHOB|nr:hypothetical protein [Psychromarinibacter sediminicola]MDF0603466.1 hypothetical protein [Psychromarinibacter sediminicola]
MPDLQPLPDADIDRRIAAHLDPGETVLWQGTPRPATFVSPVGTLLCIGLIALGLAIFTGLIDRYAFFPAPPGSLQRLLPAAALVVVGGIVLASLWTRRGANWAYAITDRRLMSARGDTLVRSVEPGDISRFDTHRDAVYWRTLDVPTRDRQSRNRESRYPGFHGQDDPQGMLRTLEDWREGFSRRAGDSAAAFVAAAGTDAPAEAPPEGIRRLRHPATGLTLDIPADWEATVSQDRIGPLRLFGVTLLKRFDRPGEERPYEDGARWNRLTVRGAPDAGLTLIVLDEPLTKTLREVRDDPWARRLNLTFLKETPELEIGGLRGFSLVRQMPAGARLVGFGKVSAPVATRQAWLGHGAMHLEIVGMARLDQPDVQRAVDAMIDSIRLP